ncbi:MAG: uroporphyrinogen decarboxylase family protein [Smithella sp.]|jgi:uroporphyrinogen decarboxylase
MTKDSPLPLIAPLGTSIGMRLIRAEAREALFNPSVHAEAVGAFLNRFPDIDFAFSLMDTSIEARALGCPYEFMGRVPAISANPCASPDDVCSLNIPEPWNTDPMRINLESVAKIRTFTGKPLASYVVGPATLAAHLYGITSLIKISRRDAQGFKRILEHAGAVSRRYAECLLKAGADFIVILEPQALIFSPKTFDDAIRPAVEKLAKIIPQAILHVCGDTNRHAAAFSKSVNIFGISLDWQVDFSQLKGSVGAKTLIGNIDPVGVLQKGSRDIVRDKVLNLMNAMKGNNFILSTGCDMVPDTPPENLDALIAAALDWREQKNIN